MNDSYTTNPKIFVGVLTWNKKSDILELLDSLQKVDYRNVEIVVVDNHSQDGTVEAIRRQYSKVHLIQNTKNMGTAGFNKAMQYALEQNADFLFILEDGTILDPKVLKELLAVAQSDKTIGVVCPKVYRYDKPDVIWMALGPRINMYTYRHYGYVMNVPEDGTYDLARECDTFPGGFLFVRTEVLRRVGMFDGDYFLYHDDDDWCTKVRQQGWRLVFAPKAKVWHKPSASVGLESPSFYYYRSRNRLLFMKKNARLVHWVFFIPYFTVQYLWDVVYPLVRQKHWPRLRGGLEGIADFFRGRVGQRPSG